MEQEIPGLMSAQALALKETPQEGLPLPRGLPILYHPPHPLDLRRSLPLRFCPLRSPGTELDQALDGLRPLVLTPSLVPLQFRRTGYPSGSM